MDLSTFNKKLKQLVNKARKHEAREKFEDAKDAWIDVAEFTIHFYKHTKLEPSFRNMLINKTEGIIQHVKNLDKKVRMSETLSGLSREQGEPHEQPSPKDKGKDQQTEETLQQDSGPPSGAGVGQKKSVSDARQEIRIKESSSDDEITEEPKTAKLPTVPSQTPQEEPEIVEDSEFKNMPEGFKEIKPPRDFEVITPHDKEEIEKRLSISGDMSVFKYENEEDSPKGENTINQANEVMENKSESKKEAIICFACGEKNPPGTKKCSNCGTELE